VIGNYERNFTGLSDLINTTILISLQMETSTTENTSSYATTLV
jgi:hypothetical protein